MPTYFPVLLSKGAEFAALEQLGSSFQDLRPIFDVIPRPKRKKPLTEIGWYQEIAPKILTFGKTKSIIVDPTYMETYDSTCTVEALYDYLAQLVKIAKDRIDVIPTVRLTMAPAALGAARDLAMVTGSGVALRLVHDEIGSSASVRTGSFKAQVDAVLEASGAERSRTDLILDLGQLASDASESALVGMLQTFIGDHGAGWREIVVVGSSAAVENSVAGFTMATLRRRELSIWQQLVAGRNESAAVSFGDYAGFAPSAPIENARTKHPSLRYTSTHEAHLIRRQAPKGGGLAVYTQVCEFVVGEPWYFGSGYSWGDDCIEQTALHLTTPSGGGTMRWRASSLNHHMTLTSQQIANHLAP